MAEMGFFQQIKSGLGQTAPGRAFTVGVGESFGFQYGNQDQFIQGRGALQRHGFLGGRNSLRVQMTKEWMSQEGKTMARGAVGSAERKAFTAALKKGVGRKMMWARGASVFNLALMAHGIYSGYQEEGMWGAAKGFGQTALTWGIMKAAAAAIGGTTLAVASIGVAAVAGGYALGEASQAYAKRMRSVEMGAPVIDPYGSIATTRQRSLMALQNTHINGRMAMGNEGILMHENAYSRR